jgi:MFS family permease
VLAAFRLIAGNRKLVRLFAGEFVSNIGDWLYLVALLVVVYRESSDPVLLGVVGGARIIPYVLLSVFAGVIIDRYDRRLILIVTDVLRGVAMIGLAANTFMDGPVLLSIALAIFATCFAVFFRPSIGAYLPSLVRNESELGPANSFFATLQELTFILGPAIAGVIIATTDLGWAFVINAASFLAPVAILWTLPPNVPGGASKAAEGASEASADGSAASAGGSAAAAGDVAPEVGAAPASVAPAPSTPAPSRRALMKPIGGLGVLEVVAQFLWGGLSVALVIFAVDRLRAGEDATGYLWAASGAGGVIGATASGSLILRTNLGPPLLLGTIVMSLGFIVLGLVETVPLALVALIVVSAGTILEEVIRETVLQRIVPDEFRGRALGTFQTLTTLSYAAGSFAVPILMVSLGAPILLGAGGVAVMVAGLLTILLVGPAFQRAPDVEAVASVLARVARLPLFAGVPPAALEVALKRLVDVPVAAGQVVIREGEPADRFYIIQSGRFAVDQVDPATGQDRRLRVMGPDEVFGELGLMHGAPRSATVRAQTDGRLLALDGPDFLALVNAGPEISSRMMDRYRASATPLA